MKRLYHRGIYAVATAVLWVLDWIIWPGIQLVWQIEALRSRAWLYLESNRENEDHVP